MIEQILKWGGIVFVVIGIICLFWEAFSSLRRRSNPKLTIVGVVFLAISVIGYAITELILIDKDVSIAFSVIWIGCLWAYLICNVISAILISRKNRANKKSFQQNNATDKPVQGVASKDQLADEDLAVADETN